MNPIAALALVAAGVLAAWYLWRLFRLVKTDGHVGRASSGLPHDWSPSADLPSLPYVVKPRR
jgi:hypothetical protein